MDNEYNSNQNWSSWDSEYYPKPQQSEKPKKKGFSAKSVIALALVCTLLGGAAGVGGALLVINANQPGVPEGTTTVLHGDRGNTVLTDVVIPTGELMTKAEVYAANVNSTVGITTSITTNFWGYQTTSAASGSGFIVTPDGYILTNYHVIENSNSITVSLYDGTSYEAALIGFDVSNDIAVLKVDATDLVPVIIGNSDNMNVGDDVVAIGNPLGELTFSLTAGAVSAIDREVTMSNGATMNLIQTDCAINSGNSGGALFNMYGEVIGITNAKLSGNSGSGASIDNIGFAIPVNHVWDMISSIIEKGYISKPYIGVSVITVSQETQSYGLPQGAAVRSVEEGSPAAEAGLQENDIITTVNGTAITGSNELVDLVSQHKIGETISLKVYRRGEILDISVTVGEKIQGALGEGTAQPQSPTGPNGFRN